MGLTAHHAGVGPGLDVSPTRPARGGPVRFRRVRRSGGQRHSAVAPEHVLGAIAAPTSGFVRGRAGRCDRLRLGTALRDVEWTDAQRSTPVGPGRACDRHLAGRVGIGTSLVARDAVAFRNGAGSGGRPSTHWPAPRTQSPPCESRTAQLLRCHAPMGRRGRTPRPGRRRSNAGIVQPGSDGELAGPCGGAAGPR